MASVVEFAYPVQEMGQALTRLEAAVLLCLARPKKEAVHAVRTSARRAEAQMELLALLPKLPAHAAEAQETAGLLKKLRKAAGKVRDVDVQRDLVKKQAGAAEGDAKAKKRKQKEAEELADLLKRRRRREAKRLEKKLHRLEGEIPLVFQRLVEALEPAEDVRLSQAELMQKVRRWYRQGAAKQPDPNDVDAMHGLRKRAKLARYLAETAPEGARSAQRMAKEFEALQEAGGTWHDWLVLGQLAEEELGCKAELPGLYRTKTEEALGVYREKLEAKDSGSNGRRSIRRKVTEKNRSSGG